MLSARDEIKKANAEVDKDQKQSALHCDGENFAGAQAKIQEARAQILANLKQSPVNPSLARKALGRALHTIQDFYAHSNWVELGKRISNFDLISGSNMDAYVAGLTDMTCNDCVYSIVNSPECLIDCESNTNGFTKLTSGYYFHEDRPLNGSIKPYKCHHGRPTRPCMPPPVLDWTLARWIHLTGGT